MGETNFPLNDPLAVDRYSLDLAIAAGERLYFSKFIGKSNNSMIVMKTELEKEAGDNVTMGLRDRLRGDGTEGDDKIEGTDAEEKLIFFNDKLFVDQKRKSTLSKGKMSEKRVPWNLREQAKNALADWNAEYEDEQYFLYLSGARGINTNMIAPLGFTGRANNPLQEPDTDHLIYGGDATGKADLTSADVMNAEMAERLVAIAETSDPEILPFKVDGEDKHILLMHTFQHFNLRKSYSSGDWGDIQKAAGARGSKNLIYKNSAGEISGIILHKHRKVVRFGDYGSGSNLPAARALLLGAMAGMVAYGGGIKGSRGYDWNEEKYDRGNGLAVTTSKIFGVKKTRYKNAQGVNQGDYAVIAVDTAYTSPR